MDHIKYENIVSVIERFFSYLNGKFSYIEKMLSLDGFKLVRPSEDRGGGPCLMG